jgi:hypothetical protein
MQASARQINYHCAKNSKQFFPIVSYYRAHIQTEINGKDITDTLMNAATMSYHLTSIDAFGIIARSLQSRGAFAMMCSKIDMNNVQMMGRWHNGAMMRYSHVQAHPTIERYAATMFKNCTYTFQHRETVPIIDSYAEALKIIQALCTIPTHHFNKVDGVNTRAAPPS